MAQALVIFLVTLVTAFLFPPAVHGSSGTEGSTETRVAFEDARWTLNGRLSYRASQAEALLMNVRMFNATSAARHRRNYDAERNTEEFLAKISDATVYGTPKALAAPKRVFQKLIVGPSPSEKPQGTKAEAGDVGSIVDAGRQSHGASQPGEARATFKTPSNRDEIYFPPPESRGGWRKLDAPDQIRQRTSMDRAKLDSLRQWLLESDGRSFAAVVIHKGYIVLEVERGNSSKTDSRRVASVSKAICATVLAIASEQSRRGLIPKEMSFDDPAFDFIPWAQPLSDPRKAMITVRQLLNHTSGICPEATGARNKGTWQYILGHSGHARTARLAFDPGTACGYSTHALAHAALVCETVTGKPYDVFAVEALFKPLGCERWWFQYYDGAEGIGRHPSHGMGMPARDLARIAYCMLRQGKWRDEQVIPRWFVDETSRPTHDVTSPEMRFKIPAQTFSHGWELPALLTGEEGTPSGRGIPPDARYKPGSGGQLIAFVPSLDLVVTRQTGSSGDWQYTEYLRRACGAVLSPKTESQAVAATRAAFPLRQAPRAVEPVLTLKRIAK